MEPEWRKEDIQDIVNLIMDKDSPLKEMRSLESPYIKK